MSHLFGSIGLPYYWAKNYPDYMGGRALEMVSLNVKKKMLKKLGEKV
jgi:hypothetical protein